MAKEEIILTQADKKRAKAIAKFKKLPVTEIEACLSDPGLREQFLQQTKRMILAEVETTKNILVLFERVESPWNRIPDEEFNQVIENVAEEFSKEQS